MFFRKFWFLKKELYRSRKALFFALFSVFASVVFSTSEPVVLGWMVDRWGGKPAAFSIHDSFFALLGLYGSVLFGKSIFQILQNRYFERATENILHGVRLKAMRHALRLKVAFLDENSSGSIVSRAINDVDSLRDLLSINMAKSIYAIAILGSYACAMVITDAFLGGLVLALLPLLAVVLFFCVKFMRSRFQLIKVLSARMNSKLAETVVGMKVIQSDQLEGARSRSFEANLDHVAHANSTIAASFGTVYFSITYYTGIALFIVLWVGYQRVESGVMTAGSLVALTAYVFGMLQPLREVVESLPLLVMGTTSAERISQFLAEPIEKDLCFKDGRSPNEVLPFMTKEGELQPLLKVESVSFSYRLDGPEVLKNISFQVCRGERIGVVGRTGSGKSTLLSLLVGFYTPTRGRILLDNQDIQNLSRKQLRSSIVLIEQSPHCFPGTWEENITVFDGRVSPRTLEAMSILGLEDRLYARVSERGSNLSLSEKQMISILRAIQEDAAIWIFDEPTSSLDKATEERVLAVLEQQKDKRAILMVAHRLNTLESCDRILEVRDGALVTRSDGKQATTGSPQAFEPQPKS